MWYNKNVPKREYKIKNWKELTTMEKMTIVKQYEAIIEKVKSVLSPAEIEFLEKRAELHAKKNASRKPS